MNLKEQFNGIQHIGIPTNDIEATIDFYKALGFEIAFRTVNEEADEEVAFLKLNTLVVETYENKAAKMEAGIDQKQALVEESKKVDEIEDFSEAVRFVNDLKKRWRKTGFGESLAEEKLREEFDANIEKVYEMINQAGLNTTNDTVHFLPFWENGVKFFTIEGPNKEKVEFSQYL